MTTTALSTVIGVFPTLDQAEKAIDELRHAQFSYDRIRLVERGTGGFTDTLKGLFTGQGSVASNTTDDLIKMGMPDYEAQHYQRELDAQNVLVLMNADERPQDAFVIMRQSGGFDINARFRAAPSNTSVEADNRRGVQEAPVQEAPVQEAPPPPSQTPSVAPSYNAPSQ